MIGVGPVDFFRDPVDRIAGRLAKEIKLPPSIDDHEADKFDTRVKESLGADEEVVYWKIKKGGFFATLGV